MNSLITAAFLLPFLLVGGDGSNGSRMDEKVKRSVYASSCEIPPSLHYHCDCKVSELYCTALNSTSYFSGFKSSTISSLHIRKSNIKCLNLSDLVGFKSLATLIIAESNLISVCEDTDNNRIFTNLRKLQTLDLSNNKLTTFDQILQFGQLRLLNISHNELSILPTNLPPLLEIADFSFNRFSVDVKENGFSEWPQSLQYINIKGNPWPCSPSLSWMYPWSISLSQSARLGLGEVKCKISETERESPLILVMETYHREVLPECTDLCTCDIYHFGISSIAHTYTLKVNCSGRELTEFPSVPLYTTILDLANNKLSDASYKQMDVKALNYLDITGLVLSNNQFSYLGNELLQLKLHRFLKVDKNLLSEIPYDISLLAQRFDTELTLGKNPWLCGCNAEINSVNLVHKMSDLDSVVCGDKSQPETIIGKKVTEVDQGILCPVTDEGERREMMLQLVCVGLAICIIIVVAKLTYDYWNYKNKGKLPWIVYKMP